MQRPPGGRFRRINSESGHARAARERLESRGRACVPQKGQSAERPRQADRSRPERPVAGADSSRTENTLERPDFRLSSVPPDARKEPESCAPKDSISEVWREEAGWLDHLGGGARVSLGPVGRLMVVQALHTRRMPFPSPLYLSRCTSESRLSTLIVLPQLNFVLSRLLDRRRYRKPHDLKTEENPEACLHISPSSSSEQPDPARNF